MFGDELKYPLPGDIDLTEDDVFRQRFRFISINTGSEGKLPWEKSDAIDSMISRYIFNDTMMSSTMSINPISVNMDDWFVESEPSGTLRFNTTTSTAREIMFTRNNDYTITYTTDDSLISVITNANNIFRSDYTDASDEFKEFTDHYKGLPFSPIFNGVKEKQKDYKYGIHGRKSFMSEYAYYPLSFQYVKSLYIDDFKHCNFGCDRYRRPFSLRRTRSFEPDGIILYDEHGEYDYEISSVKLHDDVTGYLETDNRLPWEMEGRWFIRA